MTGPTKALTKLVFVTAFITALFAPATAWSYTAIAYSNSSPNIAYIGKGQTSATAAEDALHTCQVDLKRGGFVPLCRITLAYENPGWFAIVCGEIACGAALGKGSLGEAQDAAYDECYKQQRSCYTKMTAYGQDVYPGPSAPSKKKQ